MTGQNETISVIIPVYNVEKYIDRCLQSVVDQSYRDMEIIIVDDGSTDLSSEICKRWGEKDSRIKLISQKNSGAGAARNNGLKCAMGGVYNIH